MSGAGTKTDDIKRRSMRLSDLTAAPYNPRRISEGALAGLSASIARFGLVQPIIWNQRTKRVVGGHQRLKALVAQGIEETEVVVVDLPESEEKALNIALNSEAISGEFVQEDLDALLVELKEGDPILFDELRLEELASATLFEATGQTEEDAVPEVPEEAVSERGKVYSLGQHRLMCGDSTSEADVGRLLGGEEPFLMVTDPPYGVEYDPSWRSEVNHDGPESRRALGKVINDDRSDWTAAWALFHGCVCYVWHGALHSSTVARNLIETGLLVRSQIIWAKDHHSFGRGAYHWQHEPCWYAVRKGSSARWCGDRSQSTIWNIPKNANNETGHGTQKPVECMARPIRNHGQKGDGVYDPFVGSGTTLIACEKLDRRAFAMEIEPAYVDVCRRRWAEFVHGKDCDWQALTPEADA